MTINDIYNTLCVDGIITLEGTTSILDSIHTRLIKKKHRELQKQGEFADRSVQLSFTLLEEETADHLAKLEITLAGRGDMLEGVKVC